MNQINWTIPNPTGKGRISVPGPVVVGSHRHPDHNKDVDRFKLEMSKSSRKFAQIEGVA